MISIEAYIIGGLVIFYTAIIGRKVFPKAAFVIGYWLGFITFFFGLGLLVFYPKEYRYDYQGIEMVERSEGGDVKVFFRHRGEVYPLRDFMTVDSTLTDTLHIYNQIRVKHGFTYRAWASDEEFIVRKKYDSYIIHLNRNDEIQENANQ